MMEPVGTVWVQKHSGGLDVDVSVHADDERPAVYAWVADGEILYIGKAGKGLRRRMAQHRVGFRSSARGKAHAEFLSNLSDLGKVVVLHAMWPGTIQVAGQQIPVHSSIEEWLIATIEPKPIRNHV